MNGMSGTFQSQSILDLLDLGLQTMVRHPVGAQTVNGSYRRVESA